MNSNYTASLYHRTPKKAISISKKNHIGGYFLSSDTIPCANSPQAADQPYDTRAVRKQSGICGCVGASADCFPVPPYVLQQEQGKHRRSESLTPPA